MNVMSASFTEIYCSSANVVINKMGTYFGHKIQNQIVCIWGSGAKDDLWALILTTG
jgi:hypothetical protein